MVPKVVEAILNMPETVHINMRYTSVMLLGELCEWISHEQHSETLGNNIYDFSLKLFLIIDLLCIIIFMYESISNFNR